MERDTFLRVMKLVQNRQWLLWTKPCRALEVEDILNRCVLLLLGGFKTNAIR